MKKASVTMIDIENITSNLLSKLLTGVEQIKAQNITHPVTIGNMYEGLMVSLVSELIESAFPSIKLIVASNCFIEGSDIEYDVIVSWQKGKRIPFTKNQRVFQVKDVLAAIQVKSQLYYKAIDESYENLRGLYDLSASINVDKKMEESAGRGTIALTGISNVKDLFDNVYAVTLYRALLMSERIPLRVVWGYNGFKQEKSFRNKIVRYYNSRIGVRDFGPINWPDIMVCGKHSLIKQDAKPFYDPIKDVSECWWDFYSSTQSNPFLLLFELLRYRISRSVVTFDDSLYPDSEIQRNSFFKARSKSGPTSTVMAWELQYVDFKSKKGKSKGGR